MARLASDADLWYNRTYDCCGSKGTRIPLKPISNSPELVETEASHYEYFTLKSSSLQIFLCFLLLWRKASMTLPKDPQKREAYLEKQRQATRARWKNPEFRNDVLQKREEANKTPETKERRSKAALQRHNDPANAEKHKADEEVRIAALRTPQARARTSAAQLKRFNDPANAEQNELWREHQREAMQRPEVGAKISKAAKERLADPEVRKAMSERGKEAMNRPEVKQKCSETRKVTHNTPEVKKRLSEAQIKRFENPEERKKTSEATKVAMVNVFNSDTYRQNLAAAMSIVHKNHGPTSIEIAVETLLQTLGIEYLPQKHIGYWTVDFLLPQYTLVVECDGTYWHSSERVKERDKKKDAYLNERGYQVLRLSEDDIRAKKFETLLLALGLQAN